MPFHAIYVSKCLPSPEPEYLFIDVLQLGYYFIHILLESCSSLPQSPHLCLDCSIISVLVCQCHRCIAVTSVNFVMAPYYLIISMH